MLSQYPLSALQGLSGVTSEINLQNQELRSRLPCTDPKSGLRPEMGKKWPKNGFWPHREKGKKWPKNGKVAIFDPFLGHFWANLPIFRPFFPFFPVSPKSIFRPFFSHFGPEARLGSVQGNRDRKPRVRLSCTVGSSSRSALLLVSRRSFLSVDLVDKSAVWDPPGEHLPSVQQYSRSPRLNTLGFAYIRSGQDLSIGLS